MLHDVYSRGRFGSWRYEIGNMEHSVKVGLDIARHLIARHARGTLVEVGQASSRRSNWAIISTSSQ